MTPKQISLFFASFNNAASSLGLSTSEEKERYRKQVLAEVAGVDSVKKLNSGDFDRCLLRFSMDSGDYHAANRAECQQAKRLGYVIKVMAAQIMQLSGLDESSARSYFNAIIEQSRLGGGFVACNESFYLDLPMVKLHKLMQILSIHLLRLKRRFFPDFKLSFDDTVRYEIDGRIKTRIGVEKDYYADLPFSVTFK